MVFHQFSFNTNQDSPDVEVLDYQYGAQNGWGSYADKRDVADGRVFPYGGTAGGMPRPDYLYVKWRIKASGQTYEDKVDLTRRLPADMFNCGVHFVIKQTQLYIYLIPPPGIFPALAIRRAATDEGMVDYLKKHQIYPDQSK